MADLSNVVRMLIHQLDATRSYLLPGYCDEDEKARAVIAFAESALAAEPPAPAPADHVPDAGNMVAADGEREEREELARWLEFEADNAQELGCATIYDHDRLRWVAGYLRQLAPAPAPAADGEHEELAQWLEGEARSCAAQFHDRITRAAALLRQLPPEGLLAVEYVHIDSGARIISEPNEGCSVGHWAVLDSRHVNPCTEFRTVADAAAALKQEVGDE